MRRRTFTPEQRAKPRPSLQEVTDSWVDLTWERRPLDLPALDRFLGEVDRTHDLGGLVIGRWGAATLPAAAEWFVSRGWLEQYQLLRHLLESDAAREDLAELQLPTDVAPALASLYGPRRGAIGLDGDLATLLVEGGAHVRHDGPARGAKDLATGAVDALTGRRYEDFHVASSHEAWTPWFHDVAWDHTYVLTDLEACEVTLLCITDTD